MRTDGTVGTMPTGARMWSLMDGRELEIPEMAKLMGHELAMLSLQGINEKQLCHMIGMSLHKGVAGFLMLGLLASLVCEC